MIVSVSNSLRLCIDGRNQFHDGNQANEREYELKKPDNLFNIMYFPWQFFLV